MAEHRTTIRALPEPCLLSIFAALDDFWLLRTTIPAVCKAWRDVCIANSAQLYSHVLIDFSVEGIPAPALYPEHSDQPFLDLSAVGGWLARRLLRGPAAERPPLRLEVRHSDGFQWPALGDLAIAHQWTPAGLAALLASLGSSLCSLRLVVCDDLLGHGELLGALFPLTALTELRLVDVADRLSARRANAGLRCLRQLQSFAISSLDEGGGLDAFPEALCSLPQLSSLRLDGQREIRVLPETLTQLTSSLRHLAVRDCGLLALSSHVSRLTGLTSLMATPEDLVDPGHPVRRDPCLGREIAALINLQHLDLVDPCLPSESLDSLASLTALTSLSVQFYRFLSLPRQWSALSQLQTLIVSHNALDEFPECLAGITTLRQLDMSFNDFGYSHFPARTCQLAQSLRQLTSLEFSSNELNELPLWVCAITALRRLTAGHNKLRRLPAELSQLSGLEALVMPSNEFQQVPRQLESLQHLTRLNLAGTPLDEAGVSTLLSLRRLRRLVVSRSWREDEPLLRALAEQLRAKHGYSVLEVT